jgi:hypothetical protein
MAESPESLNIKIKLGTDKNLDLEVKSAWTVLELKEEIKKTN